MLFKIDVEMSNFQIEAIKKVIKLFFYSSPHPHTLFLVRKSNHQFQSKFPSASTHLCSAAQLEFITQVEEGNF
jgi:hypothetical protein